MSIEMVYNILRDTDQRRSMIQFDPLHPSSRSADDLAILSSNSSSSSRRKRQSLNAVDLPEAQGSRRARESKSGTGTLEFLMEEFGILCFEIRNPRRGNQNPGLCCIPLNGATAKAMLLPQISRNWYSLITLYLYYFGQSY